PQRWAVVVEAHSRECWFSCCRGAGALLCCVLGLASHWPRLRVVPSMGAVGAFLISCCVPLCPRWKGRISLVASLVICSVVRNLFLHRAQCVRRAGADVVF